MGANKEVIKQKVDFLNQFVQDSAVAKFNFLRTITTLSVGFLGLLIGLKPDKIPDCTSKYLFLSTITLMSLGVFSSLISQYYEVFYSREKVRIQNNQLSEYIADPTIIFQTSNILKPMIYRISDLVTFVCYSLSIVTLIGYVWFLELG